ncbi:g7797 [Coccomyxa elongata]
MQCQLGCPQLKGLASKAGIRVLLDRTRNLHSPKRCSVGLAQHLWARQREARHGTNPSTRMNTSPASLLQSQPVTGSIRLAIIGDVHSHWYEDDAEALESLGVDAAIFVGDFGEEAVGLIRRVADVHTPKAVMLGNHDAWYSLTAWARNKWIMSGAAKGDAVYEGVVKQLEILGSDHVGYTGKAFRAKSGAHFSVVGARPFSKGGRSWTDVEEFYRHTYQVDGFDTSAERIAAAVTSQPPDSVVIVAAHNGPSGLGTLHHNICGADFRPKAGDHGDPDLEVALEHVEAAGRHVPLVTFGHMHEKLCFGKKTRNMIEIHPDTGTVYLNAAFVPRVRHIKVPASNTNSNGDSETASADETTPAGGQGSKAITAHQFTVAEVTDGLVTKVSSVWVGRRGRKGGFEVVARKELLETVLDQEGQGHYVRRNIWRGFDRVWESVITRRRTTLGTGDSTIGRYVDAELGSVQVGTE